MGEGRVWVGVTADVDEDDPLIGLADSCEGKTVPALNSDSEPPESLLMLPWDARAELFGGIDGL